MSSFTFLHERSVPVSGGDLVAAECCPAMDLIALASSVHLVIQRSFKWEQLHALPCALTSMVWRPDGKTLAVGHEDGSLSIFDIERGEELHMPYTARPHGARITAMFWTNVRSMSYGSFSSFSSTSSSTSQTRGHSNIRQLLLQSTRAAHQQHDNLVLPYSDRAADLLGSCTGTTCGQQEIGSRSSSNTNRSMETGGEQGTASILIATAQSGVVAGQLPPMDVLVSGDSTGVVTISAYGFFPMGCIDLSGAFSAETVNAEEEKNRASCEWESPTVVHLAFSADLGTLVALLKANNTIVRGKVVACDESEGVSANDALSNDAKHNTLGASGVHNKASTIRNDRKQDVTKPKQTTAEERSENVVFASSKVQQEVEKRVHYRLVSIDTSLVRDRSIELRHIALQCGYIGEHIRAAESAIEKMASTWSSGITPLKKQLEPLRTQLHQYGRQVSPESELFMMLTCGVASGALQHYISGLYEGSLARLAKTLDVACATMEMISTHSLMSAAEALTFRLSDLVGLSGWQHRFNAIGVTVDEMKSVLNAAELLMLKTAQINLWVRDARANFLAFTLWLRGVVRKQAALSGDDTVAGGLNGRDSKSVPLPLPDTQRLVKLLEPGMNIEVEVNGDGVRGGEKRSIGLDPVGGGEHGTSTSSSFPERELSHSHISEQFQNAPLSSNKSSRNNNKNNNQDLLLSSADPEEHSTSLRQSLELLRERWRLAFDQAAETVTHSFRPVSNVSLCSLPLDNKLATHSGSDGISTDDDTEAVDHATAAAAESTSIDRLFALHVHTGQRTTSNDIGNCIIMVFTPNSTDGMLYIIRQHVVNLTNRSKGNSSTNTRQWNAACVELPAGSVVYDVQVAGQKPGGMDSGTAAAAASEITTRVVVVLKDSEKGACLVMIDCQELDWRVVEECPCLTSLGNNVKQGSGGSEGEQEDRMILVSQLKKEMRNKKAVSELHSLDPQVRVLLPKDREPASLALSGPRGIACVCTKNQRLSLYDIEVDEEQSDGDEDDYDDDDGMDD